MSNGILIKSWYEDESDNTLLELLPILVLIASKKVEDVREALEKLKSQMLQEVAKGNPSPHTNLSL